MKKVNYYSDIFKKEVVYSVLSGKYTKEEARNYYNIGGSSTILEWIRIFEKEDLIDLFMKKQEELSQEEQASKIRLLENQLKQKDLEVTALNTLINIAEKEFNIPIRKKSGAKQSKKSKNKTSQKK